MVIGSFKYLSRSREFWRVVQILRVNASAATAPRQWILDIFMPQPPLYGHWIIQIFKPIPGVVAGGTVSKGICEGARQWILNTFKPFGLVVRRHRDFPKDRQTTALKSKYLFQ